MHEKDYKILLKGSTNGEDQNMRCIIQKGQNTQLLILFPKLDISATFVLYISVYKK